MPTPKPSPTRRGPAPKPPAKSRSATPAKRAPKPGAAAANASNRSAATAANAAAKKRTQPTSGKMSNMAEDVGYAPGVWTKGAKSMGPDWDNPAYNARKAAAKKAASPTSSRKTTAKTPLPERLRVPKQGTVQMTGNRYKNEADTANRARARTAARKSGKK